MKEFKKRLTILMGDMSVNEFAKKCKIPYSTMRDYIENDANPKLDNLAKIAACFETSIAWIVGESDTGAEKKYRGLTYERHVEVGEDLKKINHMLSSLWMEFGNSYPESGDLHRATKYLWMAQEAVSKARCYAEENLFVEHKERANYDVYYGRSIDDNDSLKKRRDNTNDGGLPEIKSDAVS